MKTKILTAFLALALLTGCVADYSKGFRTGTITKFSYKGTWYKTWEGELVMGGMRSNGDGGVQANVFQFSIDGQAKRGEDVASLAAQLEDAASQEKRVKIFYAEDHSTPFAVSRGSTDYFVQRVEVLD